MAFGDTSQFCCCVQDIIIDEPRYRVIRFDDEGLFQWGRVEAYSHLWYGSAGEGLLGVINISKDNTENKFEVRSFDVDDGSIANFTEIDWPITWSWETPFIQSNGNLIITTKQNEGFDPELWLAFDFNGDLVATSTLIGMTMPNIGGWGINNPEDVVRLGRNPRNQNVQYIAKDEVRGIAYDGKTWTEYTIYEIKANLVLEEKDKIWIAGIDHSNPFVAYSFEFIYENGYVMLITPALNFFGFPVPGQTSQTIIACGATVDAQTTWDGFYTSDVTAGGRDGQLIHLGGGQVQGAINSFEYAWWDLDENVLKQISMPPPFFTDSISRIYEDANLWEIRRPNYNAKYELRKFSSGSVDFDNPDDYIEAEPSWGSAYESHVDAPSNIVRNKVGNSWQINWVWPPDPNPALNHVGKDFSERLLISEGINIWRVQRPLQELIDVLPDTNTGRIGAGMLAATTADAISGYTVLAYSGGYPIHSGFLRSENVLDPDP